MTQKWRYKVCRCVRRRAKWGQNSGLGRRVIFPYSKIVTPGSMLFFVLIWRRIGTRFGSILQDFWHSSDNPSKVDELPIKHFKICNFHHQVAFAFRKNWNTKLIVPDLSYAPSNAHWSEIIYFWCTMQNEFMDHEKSSKNLTFGTPSRGKVR